jgi:di/tricarboxylate transporter
MSTPPNAIAYSSGHVTASQMFKIGFLVNAAAFFVLIAWMTMMS